ncbi:MAG TPA: GTPase Era [Geopsychrobacteraceae bacterium]|nr:GTPase Era [Geopsychrobacteraceae bacterium]
MTEETVFHSGFVSIVGRPNVGKSTLLNQMLGQKIAITSDKPQTTRNRILGIHNFDQGQVLFIDTPGIHKPKGKLNRFMVDQAVSACSDIDLVLFLVEANDHPGGGDEYILNILRRSGVRVALIINKIDMIEPTRLLKLIESYSAVFDFCEVVPISALTGDGVERLVKVVEPCMPEGPRYYPEEMITDQPERVIVAEMIREKVMRRTHEELPYGVAVQVESFTEKPEKNLVVIQAVINVERDSHKKIIVGRRGQMIRTLGQDARREIERFLGTRVYLELFVRVEKDWTQSDRILRELGYE